MHRGLPRIVLINICGPSLVIHKATLHSQNCTINYMVNYLLGGLYKILNHIKAF